MLRLGYRDSRSHHKRIANGERCHALLLLRVARCMLHSAPAPAPAQSRPQSRPQSVHHYVNALNAHVNQDEVPLICRLWSPRLLHAMDNFHSVDLIVVVACPIPAPEQVPCRASWAAWAA